MIQIENLTKRFLDRDIIADIDLHVDEGEILAIMGSSGGGKTTLLRCISGLIKPTKGKVTVDGIDVQVEPDEARRRMGMVFQAGAPFDYLNVRDNVLFGVRRHSKPTRAEEDAIMSEYLGYVDLLGTEKLMPSELSGGMKKRLGIARALALKPKVMLYDEPTTGLDPITTYTIDSLMVRLRDELKITSLIVSHDVNSVFRVADRIAFLNGGHMTFIGSPAAFADSNDPGISEMVTKARTTSFSSAR